MALHKGSDLHAAGGHWIKDTGVGVRGHPDCPACKLGTLADASESRDNQDLVCVDCGAVYSIAYLVVAGVLPPARARACKAV